jgi:hypothetical protein
MSALLDLLAGLADSARVMGNPELIVSSVAFIPINALLGGGLHAHYGTVTTTA